MICMMPILHDIIRHLVFRVCEPFYCFVMLYHALLRFMDVKGELLKLNQRSLIPNRTYKTSECAGVIGIAKLKNKTQQCSLSKLASCSKESSKTKHFPSSHPRFASDPTRI